MGRGAYTLSEISSQPAVWRSTLDSFSRNREALSDFLDQTEFEQVVVIGCGSTHYLAKTAASLLTHYTGFPAYALPSSEVWLFRDAVPLKRTMLLSISRSGMTTETLLALRRFRAEMDGPAVAISCYPDTTWRLSPTSCWQPRMRRRRALHRLGHLPACCCCREHSQHRWAAARMS